MIKTIIYKGRIKCYGMATHFLGEKMKILVAIKRVVDHNVRIRVKDDGTGVMLDNVKMAINPFCEIAIEEAVRLKERGVASEIVAVSIGTQAATEQLRAAMALGADRAILVDAENPSPLVVAKSLAAIFKDEAPKMLLLGKQSIDGDNNQTAQMLAGILGLPQATFASKIDVDGDSAIIAREIDGGINTLKVALPAVISTDLRLNKPRFPKLPSIMAAKKKPIDVKNLTDLGIENTSGVRVLNVSAPPARSAGVVVGSVDELIAKLKEAKVL